MAHKTYHIYTKCLLSARLELFPVTWNRQSIHQLSAVDRRAGGGDISGFQICPFHGAGSNIIRTWRTKNISLEPDVRKPTAPPPFRAGTKEVRKAGARIGLSACRSTNID